MKVTNQACLQFLTMATTAAMATVLAQRDDGGVISHIQKSNGGQDTDIDQRANNQKTPLLFNDGGHDITSTTLALSDTSFPNNNKVLRNNESKLCRSNEPNQDATNRDADTGILDCGVNEYCLVLPDGIGRCVDKTFLLSYHYNNHNNDMVPLLTPSFETKSVHRTNELHSHSVGTPEVQQSRRRLIDYVCPPTMTNNCPMSPVSLVSGDTLSCTDYRACDDFEVTFDAGSTITCSSLYACQSIDATGAGTITCTGFYSCYFARVILQNGGQLECDFTNACYGADVYFEGTALMRCLTTFACGGLLGYDNNIYATVAGGTLLCRAENSCLPDFFLNDNSFLLICEDAFSCASNEYNSVEGTGSACVVCVQENSCTNLSDEFFTIGAEKNQAQLAGTCTDDQIATMCDEIDPVLASTLDFGNGLVCVSSSMAPTTSSQPSIGPSKAPTTSPQPSLVPSDMPNMMSKPSLAPFRKPSTEKKEGKKGDGKKEGNGKKGGKKGRPNTGSKIAKIAKLENVVLREP